MRERYALGPRGPHGNNWGSSGQALKPGIEGGGHTGDRYITSLAARERKWEMELQLRPGEMISEVGGPGLRAPLSKKVIGVQKGPFRPFR